MMLKTPRALLLLGLACCWFTTSHAQGFRSINGRNHPELTWQVAETEHFLIMYPQHLAGIETEAAPIAEAAYAALSTNLDVTFDRKIRIYLTDEDEITNGFAVPIGNGYTNIWVHQNAGMWTWTGREKWLRKVIAHELAHIFHFRAVTSGAPRLLHFFLGDPLPRFWTEGLAQYETERWDAQRGDRWLRTAVLDDQLSYDDGRSIWNGRLLYAVGNAQVRYFASRYGDSTLVKLLAHRKKSLFGLTRVHDFNAAFEDVTGQSYRSFYEDWRRHVNVYYNTLAGQLETIDSLAADTTQPPSLSFPGQYLYDVAYSPDTTRAAVLSLVSVHRPVRRLYVVARDDGEARIVAEGTIRPGISWSPTGEKLAFSRLSRGRYGSLLHDLYLVDADGSGLRRLTYSRRATAPAFAPDGRRLAFAGSSEGTANVFLLDLDTNQETQITSFTGDVQIADIAWHPAGNEIAFSRITPEGTRDIVTVDVASGELKRITSGEHDDRGPVWSPDGRQLAYTSLRSGVPDVFVYDPTTHAHHRVTHLVTGATVHDWLPPDSLHGAGSLVVSSSVTKRRDEAYLVDAARRASDYTLQIPAGYSSWTRHRPPREVPEMQAPDPALILRRYPYRSWRNVTHAGSLALPYFFSTDDWGLFGVTAWIEPLGKHTLVLAGNISFGALSEHSYGLASYVNNQWYPTVSLNLYRLPGTARYYSDDILVEDFLGGEVSAAWPLDRIHRPYTQETVAARLRYFDFTPLDPEDFESLDDLLPPESGQQADLTLSFTHKQQRPYRHNVVHPLDGTGLRLEVTGAAPVAGADNRFLRADVQAYRIFRSLGLQRVFVYGRIQAQTGRARAQDYLGFARYDPVEVSLPGPVPFRFSNTDRVRGYRTYALGTRVLFGSLEYRVPLLSSLQTRLLGLVTFGATTAAAFVDAGMVWTGTNLEDAVRRTGAGLEIKNALRLAGFLELAHAVGIAQPVEAFGTDGEVEIYYRLRAAVPF